MSRWDSISITAHYTAQIWVRNQNPWAWRFDTPRGRLMYHASKPLFDAMTRVGLTTPPEFCIQRHRILDARLPDLKPVQLIELAGGLSPRCLAYAQKWGVPCVDVDLPAMVEAKRSMVGPDAPEHYRQGALDLIASEDYAADLQDVLVRGAPTVVITEGILSYFSMAHQQRIFDKIAALLRWCGGGTYMTDIHHQDEVDRLGLAAAVFRWGLHKISRTEQEALIPNFGEGQQMLEQAGFDQVVGLHPNQWHEELSLPLLRKDSGLMIYEARLEV